MIIRAPVLNRSSSAEPEQQRQRGSSASGVEVIVVVEAIYNGPNHKALGMCKPGQTITVAGGPYVQSLIDSGLVQRPDVDLGALVQAALVAKMTEVVTKAKANGAKIEIAAQIEEPVDNGYLLLTESGVNALLAKKVYDAGFKTAEDIARSYRDYGTAKFTDIQGIGLNSAMKLVRWAGVEPEQVI